MSLIRPPNAKHVAGGRAGQRSMESVHNEVYTSVMITTAKELRVRTKAILDAVARGEEVLVTHRGRSCARILPAQKGKPGESTRRRSNVPLYGIWKNDKATANVADYIDQLRRGRGS
jgi:prevent-host-death family protein